MTFFFLSIGENGDDKEYLSNMYRQYYPLLKKHANAITGDLNAVDDLIQDTFLKLIPKISLLRSLNCYKKTSYIVYTLKSVCLDYLRKKTRRSPYTSNIPMDDILHQIPDLQAATEEIFVYHEELKALDQMLLQLSERDRCLLYFKYNMEMKDREIAKLLGIPANHVRQYIARAKRRALAIWSQGVEGHVKDQKPDG